MRKVNRVGFVIGFLLLSASISVGSDRTAFTVTILKDSYQFDPAQIFVEIGDTVDWVNQDQRRHLTASIPDGTEELPIFCPELFPGETCSITFSLPGRYPYFCFIHRNMVGEVIVVQ
jgi:plastocyanin